MESSLNYPSGFAERAKEHSKRFLPFLADIESSLNKHERALLELMHMDRAANRWRMGKAYNYICSVIAEHYGYLYRYYDHGTILYGDAALGEAYIDRRLHGPSGLEILGYHNEIQNKQIVVRTTLRWYCKLSNWPGEDEDEYEGSELGSELDLGNVLDNYNEVCSPQVGFDDDGNIVSESHIFDEKNFVYNMFMLENAYSQIVNFCIVEFLRYGDRRRVRQCPFCDDLFWAKDLKKKYCYSADCDKEYHRKDMQERRDADPVKYVS
jgi:hypothetical protein